jgi:hypothetical protein
VPATERGEVKRTKKAVQEDDPFSRPFDGEKGPRRYDRAPNVPRASKPFEAHGAIVREAENRLESALDPKVSIARLRAPVGKAKVGGKSPEDRIRGKLGNDLGRSSTAHGRPKGLLERRV